MPGGSRSALGESRRGGDDAARLFKQEATVTTRCKFRCIEAKNVPDGKGEPCVEVTLTVVGGDTPENAAFFKYTPGGVIRFYSLRRDAFKINAEYYVDITSVEPDPASKPTGPVIDWDATAL